jgi:hypothetical protein
MKRLVLCGALAVLAGCATHAPRPDELRQPPSDRLMAFQSPSDGSATIVVTRDAGALGSGCYLAVYIDGKDAAHLAGGERATFHLPDGHHVLGTWSTGKALCGYRKDADRREIDASLNKGETRKFRLIIDNGGLKIEPTSL